MVWFRLQQRLLCSYEGEWGTAVSASFVCQDSTLFAERIRFLVWHFSCPQAPSFFNTHVFTDYITILLDRNR